jgi:hypothetical protein
MKYLFNQGVKTLAERSGFNTAGERKYSGSVNYCTGGFSNGERVNINISFKGTQSR